MMYRIAHRYTSMRDGNRYGPWAAGAIVELDPAVADWINTDSPGACVLDEPAPGPELNETAVTEPTIEPVGESDDKSDEADEPEVPVVTEPAVTAEPEGQPEGEKPDDGGGEAETKPAAKPKKAAGQNRAHAPARTRQ